MNPLEGKPLQPLTNGGVIVIAGMKASNFDEEIKTHPRVVLWDSQNQHWHGKSLPDNTRVVFVTRFIAHSAFHNITADARKRGITIFNPEGTGLIAKQVRELLGIVKEKESVETVQKTSSYNKLQPLHQFIDFSKSTSENAKTLYEMSKSLNIQTTEASLAVMINTQRRKMRGTAVPKSIRPKLDVSVELLDGIIQSLKDMREFIVTTTHENEVLREKLIKFKKVFEEV